jgi:hypothetical protein
VQGVELRTAGFQKRCRRRAGGQSRGHHIHDSCSTAFQTTHGQDTSSRCCLFPLRRDDAARHNASRFSSAVAPQTGFAICAQTRYARISTSIPTERDARQGSAGTKALCICGTAQAAPLHSARRAAISRVRTISPRVAALKAASPAALTIHAGVRARSRGLISSRRAAFSPARLSFR